jgi:hypothetical protein
MGMDLLQTFISRCIQPLHQQEMIVDISKTKLSRSSLLCMFDDTEINTRIRGVLAHGGRSEFWH